VRTIPAEWGPRDRRQARAPNGVGDVPDEAEQLLVTGGVDAGQDPAERVASRRSRPRDLVVLTDDNDNDNDNDGRREPHLPGAHRLVRHVPRHGRGERLRQLGGTHGLGR